MEKEKDGGSDDDGVLKLQVVEDDLIINRERNKFM